MDYKGQKLCENLYYIITILFGVIAWIVGYVKADFQLTVYGWGIGMCLAELVCLPDWPFYNRNKVVWIDDFEKEEAKKTTAKPSKSSKKEKGKKDE